MNKGEVIQSPHDKNNYYAGSLPNGLKYIVISDSEADTSAASLNVSIGSMYDPEEYLGLTHFLEHSILLGTKKYPNKNEFSDFLTKNNGSSNAYTAIDSTNYHFDVSNDEFVKALDMFSQFFISPIFSNDSIERELDAVDSEFKMNFRNDNERLSNLISAEGDKASPFSKFQCGNHSTLSKPDIRLKVIEFYKAYYTPAKMTLCVLSKMKLEEMNELVIKLFSEVHQSKEFIVTPIEKKYLYTPSTMGFLYKIIPIQTKNLLEFFWVINENELLHYQEQPCLYTTLVLSHKGKNSLTSLLKKKELVISLHASHSIEGETYTTINLSLKLTQKGMDNYKEIIDIVLAFIEKLKAAEVNEQFYNELKQCADIEFKFFEKEEAVDFCIEIAENLSLFPSHKAISASYLWEIYSPELIKKTMHSLTTVNLNLYLISKEFEALQSQGVLFSIEKYYQTSFIKEKMDFSSYHLLLSKEDNDSLGYPMKNPFIPQNLDLIDYSLQSFKTDDYKYPRKIEDNAHVVWYKPDTEFKIPKCYFASYVYISNLNMDINLFSAYVSLVSYIIREELSEEVYTAELASNEISFDFFNSCLMISINGFSDSIERFMREMMKKVKDILALKSFEHLTEKVIAKLTDFIKQKKNWKLGSVNDQVREKLIFFLKKPSLDNDKLITIYEGLISTIKDKGIETIGLSDFITRLFKKTKYEWLVQGNILPSKALELISIIENALAISKDFKCTIDLNEIRMFQITQIDPNASCYHQFTSEDKENENNCLLSYIQIDDLHNDLRKKVILRILLEIFDEDFFYELRTEQNLGYYVSMEQYHLYDVAGLICFVQSTTAHPEDIFNKMNNFFNDYDLNDEEEFTDEEYAQFASSVVTNLKEKYLNLSEEFSSNFSKISHRTYNFNQREEMISLIEKSITKKDVIDFFNQYIFTSTKRFDIEVIGKNHLSVVPMEVDADDQLESIISRVKVNDPSVFQMKNRFFSKQFY